MILGVPVYERHDLTKRMVVSLAATVQGDFTLILVDNASPEPYRRGDFDVPFRMRILRNQRNEGNWYPLRQVADLEPGHEVVALAHNDVVYYEYGWNRRVEEEFLQDRLLGLLGFAGSPEIDMRGERAVGTTWSNLRGVLGEPAERGGDRDAGLHPVVSIDGLFMAFRHGAISALTLDPDLPPAHYYDYIWSAEIIEAGWHLATLGVDIDHTGWSTATALADVLDGEWGRWCVEHGYPASNPMATIRQVGSSHWEMFRGRFFPCRI